MRQQPLQNIPVNQLQPPVSAPASQTSFLMNNNQKRGSNKENNRPIKFGPMLEYDPSKDTATAAASAEARAKSKKNSKPGVSILNIPRDTPVYIYKPPKRKASSNSSSFSSDLWAASIRTSFHSIHFILSIIFTYTGYNGRHGMGHSRLGSLG